MISNYYLLLIVAVSSEHYMKMWLWLQKADSLIKSYLKILWSLL